MILDNTCKIPHAVYEFVRTTVCCLGIEPRPGVSVITWDGESVFVTVFGDQIGYWCSTVNLGCRIKELHLEGRD